MIIFLYVANYISKKIANLQLNSILIYCNFYKQHSFHSIQSNAISSETLSPCFYVLFSFRISNLWQKIHRLKDIVENIVIFVLCLKPITTSSSVSQDQREFPGLRYKPHIKGNPQNFEFEMGRVAYVIKALNSAKHVFVFTTFYIFQIQTYV